MHTHKTLRKQKDKQNKAKTNKQTKNGLHNKFLRKKEIAAR